MSEPHADRLFDGILQSAREEVASILAQAEQDAEALRQSFAEKAKDAADVEQRRTGKQIQEIERRSESAIRNLQRKHALTHNERLRSRVMQKVSEKMASLIGQESYRRVLVGWIAEAAVGLDRPEAEVACSFKERIDGPLLSEAEELVFKTTGKRVSLSPAATSLTAQGVVVSSIDGKVAYNNQVATRLARHFRSLEELMEGQTCRKE